LLERGEKEAKTKSKRGAKGRKVWNRKGAQGSLARVGGLYLDICARVPEFLKTPLLTGPVCLISQDRS